MKIYFINYLKYYLHINYTRYFVIYNKIYLFIHIILKIVFIFYIIYRYNYIINICELCYTIVLMILI